MLLDKRITVKEAIVAALITLLGSADYRQREAATVALTKMAGDACNQLMLAERDVKKDCERARRASLILDRYYADNAGTMLTAIIRIRGLKKLPWLDDCEWDKSCRSRHLNLANQLADKLQVSRFAPDWNNFRLATRLYLEDMLHHRATSQQIVEEMDRLRAAEKEWIRVRGKTWGLKVEDD